MRLQPASNVHTPRDGSLPLVTVIMPVRNEAGFLRESLGAVLAQDYPHDRLEVIVADGMSTDDTTAIIEELRHTTPDIPLTMVANPGRIVSTGLNRAIALARGSIIVRVDGHCRVRADYVSRCVAHLVREKVDGVGGPINTIATTRVGRAIAAAMSCRFGVGPSAFRTVQDETRLVDTIPFPAYTRAAIELAGPFDEELVRNQDDEYNSRLRKLGGRLLLAADVRSDYYSRTTFSSLWRQYFQYGFYKVRVMQKHPRQVHPRQFVPAVFVSTLMLAAFVSPFSAPMRAALALLVAIYVAAALGIAAAIAGRSSWRDLPAIAAAFPVLHVSYGLGMLAGVWKLMTAGRVVRPPARQRWT